MRTYRAAIFFVTVITATAGDERRDAPAPQPRLRLNPVTRTAIKEPKIEEKKTSASVVTMSPFIVRSTPINEQTNEPNREQARTPTGPISVFDGGWVTRKDIGGVHVELGAWGYQNILWKNDRLKSDPKHVGTEFLRVFW